MTKNTEVKCVKEAIERLNMDYATLVDWYISSVGDEPPVWTEEHIEELLEDYYVISKTEFEKFLKEKEETNRLKESLRDNNFFAV